MFNITLSTMIQKETGDGVTIVDFLIAVMNNELAGFEPDDRLDAAKLLIKYGRGEVPNFTLDHTPGPSLGSSSSPQDSFFDEKLAKVLQESTDGRSVCRFLINVMNGDLKAFTPHHRISAARELLSRGFGKQATPRRSGEGRNPEKAGTGSSHPLNSERPNTKIREIP